MPRGDNTLLIFPCSKSKDSPGLPRPYPAQHASQRLGSAAAQVLAEGRTLAFRKPGICIDRRSEPVPALGLYSGYQYTAAFVEHVLDAIRAGVHCLIVSGGYGLLDALEPIQNYCAHIRQTKRIWRERLPTVLRDYVTRSRITRAFIACSEPYKEVLVGDWWTVLHETHWYVPRLGYRQGASSKVPTMIGAAVCRLVEQRMTPDSRWQAQPS